MELLAEVKVSSMDPASASYQSHDEAVELDQVQILAPGYHVVFPPVPLES